METFSALLALCAGNSSVTGEFPSQRPVTRSFDGFFDLRLNKPLSKQSWGWWFETPSRSLWCHYNVGTKCIPDVFLSMGLVNSFQMQWFMVWVALSLMPSPCKATDQDFVITENEYEYDKEELVLSHWNLTSTLRESFPDPSSILVKYRYSN